jgi:hypothetical protein
MKLLKSQNTKTKSQINSKFQNQKQNTNSQNNLADLRIELHSAEAQIEGSTRLKHVWILGAWDLYIVCYLSFGA